MRYHWQHHQHSMSTFTSTHEDKFIGIQKTPFKHQISTSWPLDKQINIMNSFSFHHFQIHVLTPRSSYVGQKKRHQKTSQATLFLPRRCLPSVHKTGQIPVGDGILHILQHRFVRPIWVFPKNRGTPKWMVYIYII